MAHHAAESRLPRRGIFHFADWPVEHSAIKQRGIVATRAPFRRLHPDGVLHVLDAFSVPLIIERREMMRGTLPLFIDVRMAALAGIRLHEIIRGNVSAMGGLSGAWEIRALRTVCIVAHRRRRDGGVLDAVGRPL